MSRTLFENSKAALAFAAVTIVGAVSMVGTSEDGGVLTAVVERFGSKPGDQAGATETGADNREGTAGAANASGRGDPASVFGSYSGEGPAAPSAGLIGNPMTAPLSPTAVVSPDAPTEPETPSYTGQDEVPPPSE